jgi:hypothetical protein
MAIFIRFDAENIAKHNKLPLVEAPVLLRQPAASVDFFRLAAFTGSPPRP